MPELPEVETIKRDLAKNLVGRKITKVDFLWPGILKGETTKKFSPAVIGTTISGVERRAKNLAVKLNNGQNLLFHMKMTGHLIITEGDWQVDEFGKWLHKNGQESPLYDPLNQYIRLIFWLDNGKILAFSDLRKFAYVKMMNSDQLQEFFNAYGPEPLTDAFTQSYLTDILQSKKIAIKKVLMDQSLIAGIGNIYADEILFEAKIHPLKPASELKEEQISPLFKAIKKVLDKAVEARGTSVSDFRDTEGKKGEFEKQLKVYRRTGQPCYNDGTKIERIVVGGRGTHFCPTEQKL